MGLAAGQFDKILATLLGQSGFAERRREHRVSIAAAVLLTPDVGNGGEHPPIHALLTDLSPGGAGFTHHAELAVGHRMIMHLPVTGRERVAARCEVRHCERIRENWFLIGVAFLDRTTD